MLRVALSCGSIDDAVFQPGCYYDVAVSFYFDLFGMASEAAADQRTDSYHWCLDERASPDLGLFKRSQDNLFVEAKDFAASASDADAGDTLTLSLDRNDGRKFSFSSSGSMGTSQFLGVDGAYIPRSGSSYGRDHSNPLPSNSHSIASSSAGPPVPTPIPTRAPTPHLSPHRVRQQPCHYQQLEYQP